MNAVDIMKNGHKTVLSVINGLDEDHWHTPGACGKWSVKDILAHLASYEWMLVEALTEVIEAGARTPLLERYRRDPHGFNDDEVEKRSDKGINQVLEEYKEAYQESSALAEQVPDGAWSQNGVLPWYGDAYDLDDFIAYSFYGHKREHGAQIAAFRDRVEE